MVADNISLDIFLTVSFWLNGDMLVLPLPARRKFGSALCMQQEDTHKWQTTVLLFGQWGSTAMPLWGSLTATCMSRVFFLNQLFWVTSVTQLAANRKIPVGRSNTSVIPHLLCIHTHTLCVRLRIFDCWSRARCGVAASSGLSLVSF